MAPRAAALRALSRGVLRGRLALCGNVDREELAVCYASADVFVHPNPREPFGIGPLEAMASGTPVVLPDAGGVLEYARAHNAWLARPTAAAFATAIAAAARGDAGRVAAARATAKSFAWEQTTAQYFPHAGRIGVAGRVCVRRQLDGKRRCRGPARSKGDTP